MTSKYDEVLKEISPKIPKTTFLLRKYHEARSENLNKYRDGVRLRGFEELIDHLELVENIFGGSPKLKKIRFLIVRSKAEFGIALEAAFSGFHSVAHDAMRSVMEIEFLFRDFYLEANRLQEWLSADAKTLNDKFRPAVLRQRYANHIGKNVTDLPEAADYKGHSTFLHVSPNINPFGVSGLSTDTSGFAVDSCFWEIFEHARRLLNALHSFANSAEENILASNNPQHLDHLAAAWECTHQMRQIAMQMMGCSVGTDKKV